MESLLTHNSVISRVLAYLFSITVMPGAEGRSKPDFAMCFPAVMRWYENARTDASLLLAFSFSVSSDLFFDAPLPLSILGRASGLRHSGDCFPDGLGCSRTRSYRILPTWVDLGDTPCKRCLCKMFHWTHNAHLSCVWDPQKYADVIIDRIACESTAQKAHHDWNEVHT